MSEGDSTMTSEPAAPQRAVTEQPPNKGNRKFVTDLAPWAETLSKSVAAIAIAVYACGFLIVSLHHSNYGFIGTNPFRPRILAAGAWFLAFSALPIVAALKYREFSWARIARNTFFIWSFCVGLSYPLSYLLFNFDNSTAIINTNWRWLLVYGIALAILVILINWKKSPPTLIAVVSVALVLVLVVPEVRRMISHDFEQGSITLWFFGVFATTIVEIKARLGRSLMEQGDWAKPLGALFIALLVFAQYYYPHLKASWGGGSPVNVTIYFSKDSPISPNKAVSAQLVEESDEGYYIVGPKETKAIYVPRSAVALVYFSDKIADSPLLRDTK